MMPLICIPTQKNLKRAQKKGDIIEIRFDEIKNFEKIFNQKTRPFLYKVTSKNPKLDELSKYKIEYVDFDIKTSKSLIRKAKKLWPKAQIIISFHDFTRTPSEKILSGLIKKMKGKGADIYKIAVTAQTFGDSLVMLEFLGKLTAEKKKAICICMGEHGTITRAAGHLFGNYIMFAPLNKKEATAPGQIAVDDLCKIHNMYKCR